MSDTEIVHWKIVEEIGIEKEKELKHSVLTYPVLAQKMCDGQILISDPENELGQTLIVDKNKEIQWKILDTVDDVPVTIDPARLISGDNIIGINRLNKSVIIVDKTCQVKWMYQNEKKGSYPISADQFKDGKIIILDRGTSSVLLINENLEKLWEWIIPEEKLLRPCCIQALDNNNFLITDEGGHRVFEANFQREIVWSYGVMGDPDVKYNHLTYPQCAIRLKSGNTMIADSMNHRIIEVDADNKICWEISNARKDNYEVNFVFWPTWVDETDEGTFLITDCRNQRIIEVDRQKKVLWEYGSTNVRKRLLAYPRSIQLTPDNSILIADTLNNRVIEINGKSEIISNKNGRAFKNQHLYWPRSAERCSENKTLISDGRHKRVILLNESAEIVREIKEYTWQNKNYFLQDPHYCTMLNNGNILIVDSLSNIILELDPEDIAQWLYDGSCSGMDNCLNDPHYVDRDSSGNTLITDSANNRMIIVDKDYGLKSEIKSIKYQNSEVKLKFPRFGKFMSNNSILVNDSNSGNVFLIDHLGKAIKVFCGEELETRIAMKKTRSIILQSDNGALISDNTFCRILKVSAN